MIVTSVPVFNILHSISTSLKGGGGLKLLSMDSLLRYSVSRSLQIASFLLKHKSFFSLNIKYRKPLKYLKIYMRGSKECL